MRTALVVVLPLLLGACRKSAPPGPSDAGVLSVVAEPLPSASAVTLDAAPVAVDAQALPPPPTLPTLPLTTEDLSLVAVGRRWGSKLIWLKALGGRVWLSGTNLDAYADEDGPLVKGPDLLADLPYTPGKHRLDVVGRYPVLFALRRKDVSGRMDSVEPAVFVRSGGSWTAANKLAIGGHPHAFLAWNGGALVVDSVIQLNASPWWDGKEQGTTFDFVAPDGTVTHPALLDDRAFMAWDGASDDKTLTLVGTKMQGSLEKGTTTGAWIARGGANGKLTLTALLPKVGIGMEAYGARLVGHGEHTVFVPPANPIVDTTWEPFRSAVYVLGEGKPDATKLEAASEHCRIEDIAVVDESTYVVRECLDARGRELLRVTGGKSLSKIALPGLVKNPGGGFRMATKDAAFACEPTSLTVRGPSDLWVVGRCGVGTERDSPSIPVVFRRGHVQEAVVLP